MLKKTIILLVLSLLFVMGTQYLRQPMTWLLKGHDWVAVQLISVFSVGTVGNIVRNLIALLVMPVSLSLIPMMLYWIVRRHFFPYFMEFVWAIWLLQIGAMLISAAPVAVAAT